MYAPITGFYSIRIGATGMEQAENDILSGSSDKLFVKRLSDYFTGRQPQGGTVDLTIDPRAQEAAYNAMSGKRGAVVAINPQTGAILAMVSTPSYDPTALAVHDPAAIQRSYNALLNDKTGSPLLNRAISQTYPTGSTFKVITTAAALSSGRFTPHSLLPAPNQLALPQTTHKLQNFQGETCGGGGGGGVRLGEGLILPCATSVV